MASKRNFGKPIIIKNQDQLEALSHFILNCEFADERNAVAFREAIDLDNPLNRLNEWLDDLGISVCSTGERKFLAAAGKLNSWREYILKHWKDSDGVRSWFHENGDDLFDAYVPYGESFATGEDFLKYIKQHKGTMPKWPFVAKRRVKAKSKSKRKR